MYIHFSAPMGRRGGLELVHLLDDARPRGRRSVPAARRRILERRSHALHAVLRSRPAEARHPAESRDGAVAHRRAVATRWWSIASGATAMACRWRSRSRGRFASVRRTRGRSIPATWQIDAAGRGHARAADGRVSRAARSRAAAARDRRASRRPAASKARCASTAHEPTLAARRRADAWRPGRYELVALSMLEDLAGNRIGRAFEVAPAAASTRDDESPFIREFALAPPLP